MKKTLILGATDNPTRYAYQAAHRLTRAGHPIVPVGIKNGQLVGQNIINHKDIQTDIHTITLYVGTHNQTEWYEYILKTKPKRIIFNPGTENPELQNLAESQGIETIEACTLVMLSVGNY
jgi:predicted CoA-binding protein